MNKIEPSKAELAEAYIYGAVGAVQGVYRYYLKPVVEDRPIAVYALCGVLGGLVVSNLVGRE